MNSMKRNANQPGEKSMSFKPDCMIIIRRQEVLKENASFEESPTLVHLFCEETPLNIHAKTNN